VITAVREKHVQQCLRVAYAVHRELLLQRDRCSRRAARRDNLQLSAAPESRGNLRRALIAGGFLTDHFPAASKAIWNFDGLYCQSRHIPGVRFPGLIHPGLIGTAPSKELLEIWNTREKTLVDAGSDLACFGVPELE